MTLEELKIYICDIGKKMVEYNFSAPMDGNVSFKHNDIIYITKSAKEKDLLTPNDLVQVDMDGNVLTNNGSPSTELPLHMTVYNERPDVTAVVHAHPPFATAFAVANKPLELNSMSEVISTLGVVPVAEYGTPSTDELPNSMLPYMKKCNAMLLANHGAITYGTSLREAWLAMQRLEHYARISFYARQLGGEVEISQKNVDRLIDVRRDVYKIDYPMFIKESNESQPSEMDEIRTLVKQLSKKLDI